jgi:hypothetical protein
MTSALLREKAPRRDASSGTLALGIVDVIVPSRAMVALVCVAALVVLEVNQQAHAMLLMSG